jgi:hypothetical protein
MFVLKSLHDEIVAAQRRSNEKLIKQVEELQAELAQLQAELAQLKSTRTNTVKFNFDAVIPFSIERLRGETVIGYRFQDDPSGTGPREWHLEIGRASCRERVSSSV